MSRLRRLAVALFLLVAVPMAFVHRGERSGYSRISNPALSVLTSVLG